MRLKDKIPGDFYKLFASKYRENYISFLLAIYEETTRLCSALSLTEAECRAIIDECMDRDGLVASDTEDLDEGESLVYSPGSARFLGNLTQWGWLKRDFDERINSYHYSFPGYGLAYMDVFKKLWSEEDDLSHESIRAVYSLLHTYLTDREKDPEILADALKASRRLVQLLSNMQDGMRTYFDELSRQREIRGVQQVLVDEINNADSKKYALLTSTDSFYRYKEAVKEIVQEILEVNERRREELEEELKELREEAGNVWGSAGMPGGSSEMSGGGPKVPGGGSEVPGGSPEMPGGSSEMPIGGPKMPGGSLEMPGGGPEMPGGGLGLPGGGQEMPGSGQDLPGGGQEMSGSCPEMPRGSSVMSGNCPVELGRRPEAGSQNPAIRRRLRRIEQSKEADSLVYQLEREFDFIEIKYNRLIEQKAVFAARANARIKYLLREGEETDDNLMAFIGVLRRCRKQGEMLRELSDSLCLTTLSRIVGENSFYAKRDEKREFHPIPPETATEDGSRAMEDFVVRPEYTQKEIDAFIRKNMADGRFQVTEQTVFDVTDLEKLLFVWRDASVGEYGMQITATDNEPVRKYGYKYTKFTMEKSENTDD